LAAIRQRIGDVRFKIYDAGYEASVAALRDALGEREFESAWADDAVLSIDEAIAYPRRGRGERKRPASGWPSLTPTARDVIRLVSEGLGTDKLASYGPAHRVVMPTVEHRQRERAVKRFTSPRHAQRFPVSVQPHLATFPSAAASTVDHRMAARWPSASPSGTRSPR